MANFYDLCPVCEENLKARASKMCNTCYQESRKTGDTERECDGSGTMKTLCKSTEPHRHCSITYTVYGRYLGEFVNDPQNSPRLDVLEPTYFQVGGCGEIIEDDGDVSWLICKYCRKEFAGESVNEAPLIFESHERIGMDGYMENGKISGSPFKPRVDAYQHGEDITDHHAQNEKTWAARARSLEEKGKRRTAN